ncbi:MAG: YkgJ family cysteine cluster protein [Candidatus Omnitrophica bacterium]|nr:YkgJ family cysteine cluster protein [Candidatus Omnitrophota bacterium]
MSKEKFSNIFDSSSEKFTCRRCHACCKKPGFVYLDRGEEVAVAVHFRMEIFDFVNRYCDLVDRQRLVLKKFDNETCIFLNSSGCTIDAARPRQCREFPIQWRTPDALNYCEGLNWGRKIK